MAKISQIRAVSTRSRAAASYLPPGVRVNPVVVELCPALRVNHPVNVNGFVGGFLDKRQASQI